MIPESVYMHFFNTFNQGVSTESYNIMKTLFWGRFVDEKGPHAKLTSTKNGLKFKVST